MIINKHNIHQYIRGNSLDCYDRGITSIEDIPDYITGIFCYSNKLTSLPSLPYNLVYLYCGDNQLTSLPYLPSGLQYLSCGYNELTSYPEDLFDKQWMINHNNQLKLDNRSTIINLINENR